MTLVAEAPARCTIPRPDKGRIVSLDAARGVAVALVMLHHFVMTAKMPSGLVSGLAYSGWCGVDLFFVLSGYLITGILLNAKASRHYFRNFYMRRILRIFPLYYGVLVVALAAMLLWAKARPFLYEQPWLWLYGTNVAIARHGWLAPLELDHFWSLAVEEHFYLVWPALVLVLRRGPLLALCCLSFLAAPLLRFWMCLHGNAVGAYVLTPCRVDALMAGAALAILARSDAGRRLLDRLAVPVLAITGIGLVVLFARSGRLEYDNPAVATVGLSLLASLFAAVIWLLLKLDPTSSWGRAVCNRVLLALGTYSYGIYVLHMFVRRGLPAPRTSSWAASIVYVLAAMGISGILAATSFHLFEQRFNRLKRFFEYGRHSKSDSSAVMMA